MVQAGQVVSVAGGRFAAGHLGELTRIVTFEMVVAVLVETSRVQARVRVLPKDGRPPLEFGLVDPGDRFPVKFFLALFTVPSSEFPSATVEALDQAGHAIARCTAGDPPVGDCRDV